MSAELQTSVGSKVYAVLRKTKWRLLALVACCGTALSLPYHVFVAERANAKLLTGCKRLDAVTIEQALKEGANPNGDLGLSGVWCAIDRAERQFLHVGFGRRIPPLFVAVNAGLKGARSHDPSQVVKLLLDAGADPNIRDGRGTHVLDLFGFGDFGARKTLITLLVYGARDKASHILYWACLPEPFGSHRVAAMLRYFGFSAYSGSH